MTSRIKPSVKSLESAFPGKGKELRALLEGKRKPLDYPQTAKWASECYNRPSYIELVMSAANEIAETYGTEAIFGDNSGWPDFEYLNTGEPYTATLGFDRIKQRFVVTSWGDWVEAAERNGRHYD